MAEGDLHVATSTTDTLTLPRLEALLRAALVQYDVIADTRIDGEEGHTVHFTVMDEHARSFWHDRLHLWASPTYAHYPDIPAEESHD